MMSQLDCRRLAQDKSLWDDGLCLLWWVFALCFESHVEKSVVVHLVLIKAELGSLETELRCTEAYWLMFLGLAQLYLFPFVTAESSCYWIHHFMVLFLEHCFLLLQARPGIQSDQAVLAGFESCPEAGSWVDNYGKRNLGGFVIISSSDQWHSSSSSNCARFMFIFHLVQLLEKLQAILDIQLPAGWGNPLKALRSYQSTIAHS